ncbi:hypothetical protein DVA67_031390 [Solirubrobacter sp. CPCC 204708]|uniref:Uncharacterized protein n=1 Tax=Solirubrobacter deserti TaxID=2282478 RepID=A0ABT4RR55_9ACTN|nr:hypothetical protein [Solirubrobacter deserti]MBE2320509.1 hypothetical protein [Solirubrobacter deserti]MDA0140755.1 hypothetical protein [Solirubrobacter deserti]
MNKILPALLSAAALLFAGAGSAQAATPTGTDYYFTPGSYLTITDHETFGANEVKTFDLSNLYVGRITGQTSKLFKVSRCAGGEVRIDLEITLKREDLNMNRFEVFAKMFEGASCNSDDYDGGAIDGWMNAFYTRPSLINSGAVVLDIANKYEGGDFAKTSFQLYGNAVY